MAAKGFPIEFGKRVTTGTFHKIKSIRCYADGDLTFQVEGGTVSASESFVAGEDIDLPRQMTVTVVSGDFRLSGRAQG